VRDLSSKRLIVAKGAMLFVIAGSVAILLISETPTARMALLLATLIWASCRFYYFLFYVLEHYVDRNLRYAGLLALLRQVSRSRSAK
jgi:hypothetical protein